MGQKVFDFRTKQVNWKHFFALLAEFFVLLFWFSFLMDNVIERYQDFGLKKETWWSLLLHVLETMLVAPFLFVAGNYTILHTWSNLWAEALTFADRQFYEVFLVTKNWLVGLTTPYARANFLTITNYVWFDISECIDKKKLARNFYDSSRPCQFLSNQGKSFVQYLKKYR